MVNRNLYIDCKLFRKLLKILCIFRCCRMCNIFLSESIFYVELGIFVFDCGKEILYFIYLYCYISIIVNIIEL